MKRFRLMVLLVALAVPLAAAGAAEGAVYKDTKVGAGRISIKIKDGRLKRIHGGLYSHCERPNGDFNAVLRTDLRGSVKLDKGRFHVHIDDPNTLVEVNIAGHLKNGAVKGRVRMTYLDLDPTFPNNDILCDSKVRRYKAV